MLYVFQGGGTEALDRIEIILLIVFLREWEVLLLC